MAAQAKHTATQSPARSRELDSAAKHLRKAKVDLVSAIQKRDDAVRRLRDADGKVHDCQKAISQARGALLAAAGDRVECEPEPEW